MRLPASVADKLICRAPGGIFTLNRHGPADMRITGLAAAALPSMNTLNTTLECIASDRPSWWASMLSSIPASATKRSYSALIAYRALPGARMPSPCLYTAPRTRSGLPSNDLPALGAQMQAAWTGETLAYASGSLVSPSTYTSGLGGRGGRRT